MSDDPISAEALAGLRAFGPSCRLGADEQFERAKWILELANGFDGLERFRLQVAAVYFARALVELLLESAVKGDTKRTREEVEELLVRTLPRYYLLERLRIHDFHRYGLRPMPPGSVMLLGPTKLLAKGGSAALTLHPEKGLQTRVSGGSSVKLLRPLQIRGDEYLDEDVGEWCSLELVLREFLSAVPKAFAEYDRFASETAVEDELNRQVP